MHCSIANRLARRGSRWRRRGCGRPIPRWPISTAISALIILVSLWRVWLLVLRAAGGRAPAVARGALAGRPEVFSALAAWLTAASIVNIAATLKYYGSGRRQFQPRDRCGDGWRRGDPQLAALAHGTECAARR